MTRDVDLFLMQEMQKEDEQNTKCDIIDCISLDEAICHTCGIDPETGEVYDPDAGMMFPQSK